jgi:hypothetical protein
MDTTTKPNKQKPTHPWNLPISIKNARVQAAVRRELEKRGIK